MRLSEQLSILANAIIQSEGDKRIIATLQLPSNLRALAAMALMGITDKDFKKHSLKFANLALVMLKHSDVTEALDAP